MTVPKGRFIGFYATQGWDEWDGFLLPFSQTIMGELLFQGRYAVAWGQFDPAVTRHRAYHYTSASYAV